QVPRAVPPPLTNRRAMRQVPHVAEHARILDEALLARLVRLVQRLRAHLGEDALQDVRREVAQEARGAQRRRRLVDGAQRAELRLAGGGAALAGGAEEVVLLLAALEELHGWR